MNSREPADAWEAAKALGSEVLDVSLAMVALLEGRGQQHARECAAYVVGSGRLSAAREALEAILDDVTEPAGLRGHAAEALASIGDARSVPALLRQLGDVEGGVRYWCIFALGRLGDRSAVGALRTVAESQSGERHDGRLLSEEALNALSNIEGQAAT